MGVGFSTLESMSRTESYTLFEWSDMDAPLLNSRIIPMRLRDRKGCHKTAGLFCVRIAYCLMPVPFRKFLPMWRSLPAALLLLAACAAPPPPSPAAPRVELPAFRAPAVPLFVQTPYLHTWLCGDRLAEEAPKLWNGQIKGL